MLAAWAVAESFVAEDTCAGVAVFVADITSMCGHLCVVSGQLLSEQIIFPCFQTLFQGSPSLCPVRAAAMSSHDIVSMSTSFIYLTQIY